MEKNIDWGVGGGGKTRSVRHKRRNTAHPKERNVSHMREEGSRPKSLQISKSSYIRDTRSGCA